jgi:hypothetical protein
MIKFDQFIFDENKVVSVSRTQRDTTVLFLEGGHSLYFQHESAKTVWEYFERKSENLAEKMAHVPDAVSD